MEKRGDKLNILHEGRSTSLDLLNISPGKYSPKLQGHHEKSLFSPWNGKPGQLKYILNARRGVFVVITDLLMQKKGE
jgi:hypothetical protein